MLRIIKTIYHILENKRKTETSEYNRGFSDCYELMKIGFAKSEHVNLSIENFKLKRILFEFLHFEFEIMESQFQKIKDLYYAYNEDYVVIDKIFNQIAIKPQINLPQSESDDFETKLQNFLLKETIHKLISHKFTFTRLQIEQLTILSNSTVSNNDKINTIIQYLSHLETDDQWPDYDEMIKKNDALLEEVRILKQAEVERNALLIKVNQLEKSVEYLDKRLKANASLEIENRHLQTIVDLFLHRVVSNNHKHHMAEFCNKGLDPVIKYGLMIDYLNKLKIFSGYQHFKLSEEDKLELKRILSANKNKDQGLQELFNYIDFVVERDEKSIYIWLKKKTQYLK
jgi:hypothetical protein